MHGFIIIMQLLNWNLDRYFFLNLATIKLNSTYSVVFCRALSRLTLNRTCWYVKLFEGSIAILSTLMKIYSLATDTWSWNALNFSVCFESIDSSIPIKEFEVSKSKQLSTVACEGNNKQKTLEDKFANLHIFTPALENFGIIVPDTLGIVNLAIAFSFEIYAQISVIFAPYQSLP